MDLIPSPGEVEGKGLLEVSFCSIERKVERVLKDKSVGMDGSIECLGINQMLNLGGSGKKENCAVSSGKR